MAKPTCGDQSPFSSAIWCACPHFVRNSIEGPFCLLASLVLLLQFFPLQPQVILVVVVVITFIVQSIEIESAPPPEWAKESCEFALEAMKRIPIVIHAAFCPLKSGSQGRRPYSSKAVALPSWYPIMVSPP